MIVPDLIKAVEAGQEKARLEIQGKHRMNERIKQLAIEAGIISAEYNGFDSTGLTTSQRKFAELIVKECMTNLYLNGYDDAVIQIQKHFGVEE